MTDKSWDFIFGLRPVACFVAFGICLPDMMIPCFIAAAVCMCVNIIKYLTEKDYQPVAKLHDSPKPVSVAHSMAESDKDIESSIDNRFINEILGYAFSKGLSVSIDFKDQVGLFLYDETENNHKPICELLMPPEKCKYGDNAYKAAVMQMVQELDKYMGKGDVND